jgi:perosamine synthetase
MKMTGEISFPEQVFEGILNVSGSPSQLHEPEFIGNELENLRYCIESNYVSSVGGFVQEFEQLICKFTGSKYAIAVVNGTSALQVALIVAGINPNDEVLVPTLSFIATANAVSYCGAIPHFVDVDETSLGIDCEKLVDYLTEIASVKDGYCINKKTGRVIRALVPMHTFGHPSDLTQLVNISEKFNLELVEDAAESLGSTYKGRHTGTFGKLAALSFNGNKIITTGGGGAILTSSKELALKARHITTTARIAHKWEFIHDEVGFNFRMPNLNAAVGCAQFESIESKIERKRFLFQAYSLAINPIPGINVYSEPNESRSNYWLQTLILEKGFEKFRDSIIELTNKQGITTRPAWNLLNSATPYRNSPSMPTPCAESLVKRIINVPSSPNLFKNIER